MSGYSILVISLLIMLVGLVIGIVLFLPTLITKWRAFSIGLNLTFRQAYVVTSHHCNNIDFLLNVREIWFWENVPLEILTRTYLIKKNLENLKNAIIEMKHKNRPIDINILVSFDLAGRDLKDEIKKAEMNNWEFSLD